MDSDFRPVQPAAKSVQASLDSLSQTNTVAQTTFQTPEQVAADDDITAPVALVSTLSHANELAIPPTSSSIRSRLLHLYSSRKKEWLVSLVVVLIAGSITGVILIKTNTKPTVAAAKAPAQSVSVAPPKPTTVASTLSGLPVRPEANQTPVTAVMIENSLQARPQSGLSQAGVVFEAIAEGGVTRFMALFQDTAPDTIGPIRSARPYYIQWSMGFDAGYAHVGGSPDGLADIKQWGVRDLDQFANSGAYHRVSTRQAPHNVYTSVAALQQLESSKGYTSSTYSGFSRKTESPAKTPTARSINFTLSGPAYDAHYDYVAATNSYNRSEGGAAHIDANTNQPISPKVVIGLVVPYSLGALDSSGAYYSNYNVIGSGQAYVFQDGTLTLGSWSKADNKSQLTFSDASGNPLKLNPGQTWVTAVTAANKVAYTP